MDFQSNKKEALHLPLECEQSMESQEVEHMLHCCGAEILPARHISSDLLYAKAWLDLASPY
jgi:hypothetical protein